MTLEEKSIRLTSYRLGVHVMNALPQSCRQDLHELCLPNPDSDGTDRRWWFKAEYGSHPNQGVESI
jgi:hypothetical protein